MTLPPFIAELIQLLLDLAIPAALCTMVLAGLALRKEGGNFLAGGGFQKWMFWSALLLTVPQCLNWFAAEGVIVPAVVGGSASPWLSSMEATFNSFVSGVVVARIVPLVASFFVMKAALDAAQGQSPLSSIIAAIFMLSVTSTIALMQSWNSGSQFATTDMLTAAWNFLASNILPEAAGLAVVGAIIRYVRHQPVAPLVGAALAFLSISAIWKLLQSMVA
jgi:hypothetical protein